MLILKIGALIIALSVFGPVLSTAQNLGFLKDAPASHFNEKDNEMMMQTADAVLNDESANASREWKNPDTGNSGKAEVLKVFKNSAGTPCKRVRFTNLVHNGVTGKSSFTLCKETDTWMIVSNQSK